MSLWTVFPTVYPRLLTKERITGYAFITTVSAEAHVYLLHEEDFVLIQLRVRRFAGFCYRVDGRGSLVDARLESSGP